jgi:hypothetical protein
MTAPLAPTVTVILGDPVTLAVMPAEQPTAPAKAKHLEVPAMVLTQMPARDALFADLTLVNPSALGWSVSSTDLESSLGQWSILPTSRA